LTAWVGRTWARPGTQHLIAAINRYNDRLGTQFAGSMTYFSFLALVPILMVAFAVAGFVLASRPHLLVTLRSDVAAQLPAGLSTTVNGILDTAVNARLTVGTLGLAIALYSGISWMGNLRAAIQAMWRPDFDSNNEIRAENLLQYYWKSLQYLIFLGLAILVSLGLTTAGSTAQTLLLRWLGLGNISWLHPVFTVLPIVLPLLLTSTTAKLFGQVIGLLFFFNFVATVVLLVAAWIATTPGEPSAEPPNPDPLDRQCSPAKANPPRRTRSVDAALATPPMAARSRPAPRP
jgi:membrane protein